MWLEVTAMATSNFPIEAFSELLNYDITVPFVVVITPIIIFL